MDAVRSGTPHIVLTDVVMADKCGIELIREIKQVNKDIRIIATSEGGALDQGYVLDLARKLGADLVLPQPFGIKELQASIALILTRRIHEERGDLA